METLRTLWEIMTTPSVCRLIVPIILGAIAGMLHQ